MNAPAPAYRDIVSIPAVTAGVVSVGDTDGNGHANVRSLYGYSIDAADRFSEQSGIDDDYRRVARMGTFAAEHHLRFHAEMRAGDCYTVHPVWVGRTARAAHMAVLTVNATTELLSTVCEIVVVNVSLETRRAEPFPPAVAAALERAVDATGALGWTVPTSGAVGLRGSAP